MEVFCLTAPYVIKLCLALFFLCVTVTMTSFCPIFLLIQSTPLNAFLTVLYSCNMYVSCNYIWQMDHNYNGVWSYLTSSLFQFLKVTYNSRQAVAHEAVDITVKSFSGKHNFERQVSGCNWTRDSWNPVHRSLSFCWSANAEKVSRSSTHIAKFGCRHPYC